MRVVHLAKAHADVHEYLTVPTTGRQRPIGRTCTTEALIARQLGMGRHALAALRRLAMTVHLGGVPHSGRHWALVLHREKGPPGCAAG